MEPLYQVENINVFFDPETRFILPLAGALTQPQIQLAGRHILEAIAARKVTKILNDNTSITQPWLHTTQWTLEEWFPVVLGLGVRAFAWILPEKILPAAATLRAIPQTKHVQVFNSIEVARHWLLSHH